MQTAHPRLLCSLAEVRNLNLWGLDLEDVSIIARMPNAEVLSLSVNKIASLQPFSLCPKLQELYLRKNEVGPLIPDQVHGQRRATPGS